MRELDKIFIKKELLKVLGVRYVNFIVLVAILSLTLISLVYVDQGLSELNERMVNPYTNWITLKKGILTGKKEVNFINDFNNNQQLKDSLRVLGINTYNRGFLKILKQDFKTSRDYVFSTVDFTENDLLFKAVIEDYNVLWKSRELDTATLTCGIIIKETSFEELLNYSGRELSLPCFYSHNTDEIRDYMISLEVSHIVKELPNEADVIISNNLSALLEKDIRLVKNSKTRIAILSIGDSLNIEGENFLEDSYTDNIKLYGKEEVVKTYLLNRNVADSLYNHKKNDLLFYKKIDCFKTSKKANQFYYSINLANTSRVKELKSYVNVNYDIKLPVVDVESMDNFFLMSRLAELFIALLMGFSVSCTIFFLYNLIKTHFNSIKANLGTLKAFGLPDTLIFNYYFKIFMLFFIGALSLSFIITACFLLIKSIHTSTFSFNLFNKYIITYCLIILIILILFFRRSLSSVLFKPPGDLIYSR